VATKITPSRRHRETMQPLITYNVSPKLPPELEPLREIVYNLWWTWEPAARKLFRHLDPELWNRTNHNPLRMLQLSKQARLTEVANDEAFLRDLKAVHDKFKAYLAREDTYGKQRAANGPLKNPIAYFSAEFGFHESVPNYSGGLGILSGDHCKSASDLGLNFCAVTLLYRHGYFRQRINKEGGQDSELLNQNFHHLPITEVRDKTDRPLLVGVEVLNRTVYAKVWQLAVGRVVLYMLDTDLTENKPEDRPITEQLYGGDHEMRIKQEIVLGIGGVHALKAIGIEPAVYHMNEGHSAFLSLELMRRLVQEKKLNFYAALQVVAASNIFTTHTPVPAGNDAFPIDLMRRYFASYPAKVGINFEAFATFGQNRTHPSQPFNNNDPFSMTILALRTSRHSNAVSKLHGAVSRGLWKSVWSGVPEDEVPITHITNGIHTKTWTAPEFAAIYDKYLPGWEDHLTNPDFWRGVIEIPDEVLWETHQALKKRLVDFVRNRVRERRIRHNESPEHIRKANSVLDPEILTIGFARRFATYKRATLLFSDLERLEKIVTNPERPVQFIFAGKAHPKDEPGKKFIQDVYKFSRLPQFEGRIVFVEDYDHYVGRRLTQGVDLWLNTPRRPLEASGTSGMKLPPNGGLNFSVLDGWWVEASNGKNGWNIGAELPVTTKQYQPEFENEVDCASLLNVLETQIVPLFYAKPDGRLPLAWIQLMRESIRSVTPVYNTHRMVKEYTEQLYEPAAREAILLSEDGCAMATELSAWKDRIRNDWQLIRVVEVKMDADPIAVKVSDTVAISARVQLGKIEPEYVRVQAYFGETTDGHIEVPEISALGDFEKLSDGQYLYKGRLEARESGSYGLNVRVIPTHPHLFQPHELRLIAWAN